MTKFTLFYIMDRSKVLFTKLCFHSDDKDYLFRNSNIDTRPEKNSNLHTQILQIELHALHYRKSWENLLKAQCTFPFIIISFVFKTFFPWSYSDIARRKLLITYWSKDKLLKECCFTLACACSPAGNFFPTARTLIGDFEVTWHLTMKLFPAKISERATLQIILRQMVWSLTSPENRSIIMVPLQTTVSRKYNHPYSICLYKEHRSFFFSLHNNSCSQTFLQQVFGEENKLRMKLSL